MSPCRHASSSLEGVRPAAVCFVQVSWDAKDGSYTAEELRQVFSAHGPVSDVVIRQSKKKSKGSAFVEMGTLEAAAAAAGAHNGRSELPLLVVPFSKASASWLSCQKAPAGCLQYTA